MRVKHLPTVHMSTKLQFHTAVPTLLLYPDSGSCCHELLLAASVGFARCVQVYTGRTMMEEM